MSDILIIEKFNSSCVYSMVHQDGKSKKYYMKRFKIETSMLDRKYTLIQNTRGSKCIILSNLTNLELKYRYRLSNGEKKTKLIVVDSFIDVKKSKVLGKKIDYKKHMSGFIFNKINKTSVESKKKKNLDEDNNINIINNDELTLF